MKEYKKTKIEEEDKPVGSLKKPETCRGKRPHDWVLLIPEHIQRDHNLDKDEIEYFYRLEDQREAENEKVEKALTSIGIHYYRYLGIRSRFYKCSVCGKKKYESKK